MSGALTSETFQITTIKVVYLDAISNVGHECTDFYDFP